MVPLIILKEAKFSLRGEFYGLKNNLIGQNATVAEKIRKLKTGFSGYVDGLSGRSYGQVKRQMRGLEQHAKDIAAKSNSARALKGTQTEINALTPKLKEYRDAMVRARKQTGLAAGGAALAGGGVYGTRRLLNNVEEKTAAFNPMTALKSAKNTLGTYVGNLTGGSYRKAQRGLEGLKQHYGRVVAKSNNPRVLKGIQTEITKAEAGMPALRKAMIKTRVGTGLAAGGVGVGAYALGTPKGQGQYNQQYR